MTELHVLTISASIAAIVITIVNALYNSKR